MTVGEAVLRGRATPSSSASGSIDAALQRAAGPCDVARKWLLAAALGTPLRAALRDRDRRLAVVCSAGVLFALALTVVFPAALFALSPLVLGVPHVASDIRYLVLRRRLPRWWIVTVVGGCLAILLLRVAQEVQQHPHLMRAEVSTGTVWLLTAALAGALVGRSWWRLWVSLPLVAAVGVLSQLSPYLSMIVLGHLHNVVALVLWLWLFRRRPGAVWLPLLLIVAGTAWLASGAATPSIHGIGGDRGLGVDLWGVSSWLVPGMVPRVAMAITLSYVFLQAIHYCVWLAWVPQEDVRAEGTLTFRMSARSLLADFGLLGVLAILAGCAVVLGFAAFDAVRTRTVYLSIAGFHAYLELAMLAYLFTAGGVPVEPPPAAATPALSRAR